MTALDNAALFCQSRPFRFLAVPVDRSLLSRSFELHPREVAAFLDHMHGLLACFSWPHARCLYANPAYAALAGRTGESLIGLTYPELWGREEYARLAPLLARAIETGSPLSCEHELKTGSGKRLMFSLRLLPNRRNGDKVFLSMEDLTAHRRHEQAMRASIERLQRFFRAESSGIAFIRQSIIQDCNPRLAEMLDYAHADLIGMPVRQLLVRPETVFIGEHGVTLLRQRNGESLPVALTVRETQEETLWIAVDARERVQAAERIRKLALHDSLTQLPNRAHLDEYLRAAMDAASALGQKFALIFLDLDRFKRINDSLGLAAGDELLRHCADRIREFALRHSDCNNLCWAARVGGDEFVLLLALGDGHDVPLDARLDELKGLIARPIVLAEREWVVTCSIGVAIYPDHGHAALELLKNADTAMYAAKSAGRDTARRFTPALAKAAIRAINTESELRKALDRREFALFFQPILSDTGKLVSAEALLRWNHPERGVLLPDHFLESAAEIRVLNDIGLWVLEEALRHAKLWTRIGWLTARVAVNLSGVEFRNLAFVTQLEQMLKQFGLSGRALEVELTERIVMSDELGVYTTLEVLKSLGVTIAIDDFGTGYSSFARLPELPVDRIKIAGEFVRELPDSAACRAIIHSIAELARGLNLSIVAENVERVEQMECLKQLGCREVQGYLFGRPMRPGDFGRWLRTQPQRWRA